MLVNWTGLQCRLDDPQMSAQVNSLGLGPILCWTKNLA